MATKSKYYDKLSTLPSADVLTILHDCVSLLVPVSPAEMAEFDNRSKKTVLNRIEAGRKWPVVNYHK